jgi:hypothetical protein
MQNDEQNRITLAIAFIAIYLTIIVGFVEKIKLPTSQFDFINGLAFGVFVMFGMLISLMFFLYLVFTALELDFYSKKEVILDQEVSKDKISRIRKNLFNWGVRGIFVSFSYPLYYFSLQIFSIYKLWKATLLTFICFGLVYILIYIIFKDKKLKEK